MEKLSELFSNVKERLSNPFIFSYLFAWCIWNYKIVIALCFYRFNDLRVDGYKSFLDLIEKNSSTWHFLWLPLISAVGYTFLFPFIKNLILAFAAWIDTWGNNWNLKISKTQNVSIEQYLKYKMQYQEATERISKYANDEQQFNLKLATSENEKQALLEQYKVLKSEQGDKAKFLEAQLEAAQKTTKSWEKANSLASLDGEWFFKTSHSTQKVKDAIEIKYNASISNGEIVLMQEDRTYSRYFISSVICNFQDLVVYLNKQPPPGADKYEEIWYFKIQNKDLNILNGSDKSGLILELRKKVNIESPN